jgi:hypothetical protein
MYDATIRAVQRQTNVEVGKPGCAKVEPIRGDRRFDARHLRIVTLIHEPTGAIQHQVFAISGEASFLDHGGIDTDAAQGFHRVYVKSGHHD